jgi:hypothetical protein
MGFGSLDHARCLLRRALLVSGATVGLALLGVSAAQAGDGEPGRSGDAISMVTEAVQAPVSEAAARAAEPAREAARLVLPVEEAVVTVAEPAEPVLDQSAASALPAVAAVSEPVGRAAQPVAAAVGEPVQVASEPVFQAVRPVTGAVTGTVSGVAEPVLEAAGPVIEAAGPVIEAAGDIVEPVVEQVVGTVGAVAPVEEYVDAVAGGTLSGASTKLSALQQVEPADAALSEQAAASPDSAGTAAPVAGQVAAGTTSTGPGNIAGTGIAAPLASLLDLGNVLREAASNAGPTAAAESHGPAQPVQPGLPSAGPSGALAGAGPAPGSAPADVGPGSELDPRPSVSILRTDGWTLPSSPAQIPGCSPD